MCRLDLFYSAPVIVTLDSRRSINSPLRLSAICPVSLPSVPSLCPLPARRCSVSHNRLKTLSCAWAPVMSVYRYSFISLSVRLSVHLRPSLCPSPSVYHLSVSLSISLSVCPSICPSLSVRLSVRPSVICPSLCPSVRLCPSVCHLSVSLSVRLSSIRPSLCPSLSVSVRPSLCSSLSVCLSTVHISVPQVLRVLSRACS